MATLDFSELPYDLFDLLELSPDCSSKEVSKAYKKAVLKYHPDKNKDVDEEYFSWVSLAHKILKNPIHREMYLEWREWKDDEHSKLKNNRPKLNVPTDKSYKEINDELNKKHGFEDDKKALNSAEMSSKLTELMMERGNVKIEKEDIRDINKAVDDLKQNEERLKTKSQGIIKYSGSITTLDTSLKYGGLDDIGKLYNENPNSIVTNKVTSMSEAFKLSPYQKFTESNLSLEERMKEYENATNDLKLPKPKKKSLDKSDKKKDDFFD